MSAAAILLILQGIQAALAAAPQVADLVIKAKAFITALFEAKLISKEKQDAMHLHVDSLAALAAAGIVDPAWTIEADPS